MTGPPSSAASSPPSSSPMSSSSSHHLGLDLRLLAEAMNDLGARHHVLGRYDSALLRYQEAVTARMEAIRAEQEEQALLTMEASAAEEERANAGGGGSRTLTVTSNASASDGDASSSGALSSSSPSPSDDDERAERRALLVEAVENRLLETHREGEALAREEERLRPDDEATDWRAVGRGALALALQLLDDDEEEGEDEEEEEEEPEEGGLRAVVDELAPTEPLTLRGGNSIPPPGSSSSNLSVSDRRLRCLDDNLSSAVTLYNMGIAHLRNGSYGKADELFGMASGISSSDPALAALVANGRALVMYRTGRLRSATEVLMRALKLEREAVARTGGRLLRRMGESASAVSGAGDSVVVGAAEGAAGTANDSNGIDDDDDDDDNDDGSGDVDYDPPYVIDVKECAAFTLSLMGRMQLRHGDPGRAAEMCREVLRLRRAEGERVAVASSVAAAAAAGGGGGGAGGGGSNGVGNGSSSDNGSGGGGEGNNNIGATASNVVDRLKFACASYNYGLALRDSGDVDGAAEHCRTFVDAVAVVLDETPSESSGVGGVSVAGNGLPLEFRNALRVRLGRALHFLGRAQLESPSGAHTANDALRTLGRALSVRREALLRHSRSTSALNSNSNSDDSNSNSNSNRRSRRPRRLLLRDVADTLHALGRILQDVGRQRDAMAAYIEACNIYRSSSEGAGSGSGSGSRSSTRVDDGCDEDVAAVLCGMAQIRHDRGEIDEARDLYLEVLRVSTAALGPDDEFVAQIWGTLGTIQLERGEAAEAVRCFANASRILNGLATSEMGSEEEEEEEASVAEGGEEGTTTDVEHRRNDDEDDDDDDESMDTDDDAKEEEGEGGGGVGVGVGAGVAMPPSPSSPLPRTDRSSVGVGGSGGRRQQRTTNTRLRLLVGPLLPSNPMCLGFSTCAPAA